MTDATVDLQVAVRFPDDVTIYKLRLLEKGAIAKLSYVPAHC